MLWALGDPEAVLVVDETGDLKKGSQSVGVQRQYTGTAAASRTPKSRCTSCMPAMPGTAMIDRELYLPRNWIEDPARCRLAGIPERVRSATKPALATQMLARTLDAGVPAAWVTGDEGYGADPDLRAELERRGIGSVLAVACDHRVVAAGDAYRADALLRRVPARAWQLVSAGRGAKGHRWYDWAFICLDCDPSPGGQTGQRWLLARRNPKTRELAFYHCWTPRRSPWPPWSGSPGGAGPSRSASRPARAFVVWTSIRSVAGAPGIAGPALAMLAHAFLVVLAATHRTRHPPPSELISFTCNQAQHLLAALLVRR